MNQNLVISIGIKDGSIKDAHLSYLNKVEGLKDIFKRDFIVWSNFDS